MARSKSHWQIRTVISAAVKSKMTILRRGEIAITRPPFMAVSTGCYGGQIRAKRLYVEKAIQIQVGFP